MSHFDIVQVAMALVAPVTRIVEAVERGDYVVG